MQLFFGQEEYLINLEINKANQKLTPEQAFVIFDEQDSLDQIIMAFNNRSLFNNDINLLIKNHPILFNLQESNKFMAAINDAWKDVNVIFVYNNNTLPNTPLIKLIRQRGKIKELAPLNSRQLNKLVHEIVLNHQGQISNRAVVSLLNKLPNNLLIITNEIKKLLDQRINIDLEMVEEAVAKYAHQDYFALSNAIIDNDFQQIISTYYEKKQNNVAPLMIINQIASILVLAKNVWHLRKQNFNLKQISAKLNVHQFRIKKTFDLLAKNSETKIDKLLVSLANLEQGIKQGKINDQLGLDYYILNLMR